jgi:cyclopropane-fatty-acyl-phospholipid synthase
MAADLILPMHIEPVRAGMVPSLHGLSYAARFFIRIGARIQIGSVTAVLPGGRAFRFEGAKPGAEGTVFVKDMNCLGRLLRGGNVGFAEGYMAGEWDSPDVAALLQAAAANMDRVREVFAGKPVTKLVNRLLHLLNRNSKKGARRNIMAHYDLGNAFYRRWLDRSMTYSSAKFEYPDQDLSEAQRNKYRSLAERIGLNPEHSLLEIGCGWGGFAEFAAKEIGCKITGITISKEQYEFARKRLFDQGLASKTEILLQDYRDTSGQYDRVVSIEMFEAVGEEYWPAYFHKVHDVLKSDGQAGLQIITINDLYYDVYRRGADFIQKYVFPGGMLPSPKILRAQIARAGLTLRNEANFGLDYARTLSRWREGFVGAWDEIRQQGFDERFKRLWTYYLSYCEAGFRAGSIDVTQIAITRS